MKQIKKILVAMILVFALFLVACENKECPECPSTECNPSEVCQGLIDPSTCPEGPTCPEPTCDECPTFNTDKECAAAGWVKECLEGIVAPASVEFYAEDIVVGGTAKFEVEIEPANAFAGLLWLTSDPAIATVAEDGTITGVKPGKVMITAKSVLNGSVSYSEEVEVVERGLQDYEIAEREKNAIVAALQGYVSGSFDLPTTWNASAKVVYTDPNGREITRFEMPDLGEATSQNYALSGSVTYRDSVSEFNVTLKLVKVAEGKNDYEKVQFATEVAEAFLYEYLEGELVEGDITLPVSVYGVALNWTSNKAYVLANDGKFARPNNNDTVTYTITPKLGAASASKTFAITAKGYTKDEKIAYLLKDGALALANGGKFVGSIALPEYDDKFGIKLAYVSGSPELISNDGIINERKYDYDDQKVTFTVTAIYNDLNAASEAFTEVFTFDTYVAKYNDATQDVINLAKTLVQFEDHPFGAGEFKNGVGYDKVNNAQILIKGGVYGSDWKIEEVNAVKGAENFKINKDTNEVQLITQYFRYHEASLKFTHTVGEKEASFIWTINIGIGAEPHITYLGGRSHSYQASANPNERGDSLQGFSKWDKYVGIVANNNERTSQQYWSEFSGYTAYVDVPVKYNEKQYNKVIYTLDAEGNVAIYPTDEKEHVRYQMFFMEFAALHMVLPKDADGNEIIYMAAAPVMEEDEEGNKKQKTEVNADGETVGVYAPAAPETGDTKVTIEGVDYARFYYPVLSNFESVRSTYGGNFGSLYINETDHDIEIPVCAVVVDTGGKFLDGEDIKGAAKASITVYQKVLVMKAATPEGAAAGLTADKYEAKLIVLQDDYGANTSVKREQSWAFDGYRPAMLVEPKSATTPLAEGSVNVEYKFTFGIELSNKNDKFVKADGTLAASNYSQYGVDSTESKFWGTPYAVLKKNGLGFAWHSQTLYTFSSMGGGYLAGQDMELPIYFSRYYRHVENEELSDYIRNDIRNYFISLSGLTTAEYNALGIELDEEGNELEELNYEDFQAIELQFDDLGIAELEKIEKLQARLNKLYESWKQEILEQKNDVERAILALERIKEVADFEVRAQQSYINLTKGLFKDVEDALKELKDHENAEGIAKSLEDIARLIKGADFQATLSTAKRNYASLTPAQKELFDNGFKGSLFNFTKVEISHIDESMALLAEITELSDKITDANKTKVEEVYDKIYGNSSKFIPALKDKGLLPDIAIHKVDLLNEVIKLMATKGTYADIESAMVKFVGYQGNAATFVGIDYDKAGTIRNFLEGKTYFTQRDVYKQEEAFADASTVYYVVDKYEFADAHDASGNGIIRQFKSGVEYFTRSDKYTAKTETTPSSSKVYYVDAKEVDFTIVDSSNMAEAVDTVLYDYYTQHPYFYDLAVTKDANGKAWPSERVEVFPWIVVNYEFTGKETLHFYYKGTEVYTWKPSAEIDLYNEDEQDTGYNAPRTFAMIDVIHDICEDHVEHDDRNQISANNATNQAIKAELAHYYETASGNALRLNPADFKVTITHDDEKYLAGEDHNGKLSAFAEGVAYYTRSDVYTIVSDLVNPADGVVYYVVDKYTAPEAVAAPAANTRYYTRGGNASAYTYTYVSNPQASGEYCTISSYKLASDEGADGKINGFAAHVEYFTLASTEHAANTVAEEEFNIGEYYTKSTSGEYTLATAYSTTVKYYTLTPTLVTVQNPASNTTYYVRTYKLADEDGKLANATAFNNIHGSKFTHWYAYDEVDTSYRAKPVDGVEYYEGEYVKVTLSSTNTFAVAAKATADGKLYKLVGGHYEEALSTDSGDVYKLVCTKATDLEVPAYAEYIIVAESEALDSSTTYYVPKMEIVTTNKPTTDAQVAAGEYYTKVAYDYTYTRATSRAATSTPTYYKEVYTAQSGLQAFALRTDYYVEAYVKADPQPTATPFTPLFGNSFYTMSQDYVLATPNDADTALVKYESGYYVVKGYELADPQPTAIAQNNDKYYVLNGDTYSLATSYSASTPYFVISGYKKAYIQPALTSIVADQKVYYRLKTTYTVANAFEAGKTYYVLGFVKNTAAYSNGVTYYTLSYETPDTQPTAANFAAGRWFTRADKNYEYVHAYTYTANTDYYVISSTEFEAASIQPLTKAELLGDIGGIIAGDDTGRKFYTKHSFSDYLKAYYMNYYPHAEYTLVDPEGERPTSVLFFKLNADGEFEVATDVNASFVFGAEGTANARYIMTKTAAQNCSADQAYIAASFKDVKNDDLSTTWGLDVFFAELLEQAEAVVEKASSDFIAKTAKLTVDIKDALDSLPTSKEVKNGGLGTLQSTYEGLVNYKTGKIAELLKNLVSLGIITGNYYNNYTITPISLKYEDADKNVPAKRANVANIETQLGYVKDILTNIDGYYVATTDTSIEEGKVYYREHKASDYTTGYAAKEALKDKYGLVTYVEVPEAELVAGANPQRNGWVELVVAFATYTGREADVVSELINLPGALDEFKANEVMDLFEDLPSLNKITAADKTAANKVKTEYAKLTGPQLTLVETKYTLTNGIQERVDQILAKIEYLDLSAKLEAVYDLIDALPSVDKLKLDDDAANVLAAEAAFKALSETNQKLFKLAYRGVKDILDADVKKIKDLYTASIKEDEAYIAAFEAYSETELYGMVNASNLDACKDLIAKYEALSGLSLDFFKDSSDTTKNYVAEAETLTKSGLDFETLYTRLLATVRAYEEYATPAE